MTHTGGAGSLRRLHRFVDLKPERNRSYLHFKPPVSPSGGTDCRVQTCLTRTLLPSTWDLCIAGRVVLSGLFERQVSLPPFCSTILFRGDEGVPPGTVPPLPCSQVDLDRSRTCRLGYPAGEGWSVPKGPSTVGWGVPHAPSLFAVDSRKTEILLFRGTAGS